MLFNFNPEMNSVIIIDNLLSGFEIEIQYSDLD